MAKNDNDKRIIEYRAKVEKARIALGTKPKCVYVGNGLIKIHNVQINLNIVTDLNELAFMLGWVVEIAVLTRAGRNALGLPVDDTKPEDCPDALDIKMRAASLKWQIKQRELMAMEQQLETARSAELATADLLDSIGKSLE